MMIIIIIIIIIFILKDFYKYKSLHREAQRLIKPSYTQ